MALKDIIFAYTHFKEIYINFLMFKTRKDGLYFHMTKKRVYIGIDLAWGRKNRSGFCVIDDTLHIIEIGLLLSNEEILNKISFYQQNHQLKVAVDAPLCVNNAQGNRDIENQFNKDFAKYKIAMLPVNRTLLLKMFDHIRGETLKDALFKVGFSFDLQNDFALSEVYPHATLAVCFNDYKILPYKRKKGRSVVEIKKALQTYQEYMQQTFQPHPFLRQNIDLLKGQSLKDHEDCLDALISAYTLYYALHHPERCRTYQSSSGAVFTTPI